MGYTTDFSGKVRIEPPLNAEEVSFLQKFNETRRMDREEGPYFVDGPGDFGQDRTPGIRDYNRPPEGQPGLWCQWRPTDDGQFIEWDGGEKFYKSVEWMQYIINHFMIFTPDNHERLPGFTYDHILNGVIEAQGEDADDRWSLWVTDNEVEQRQGGADVIQLTGFGPATVLPDGSIRVASNTDSVEIRLVPVGPNAPIWLDDLPGKTLKVVISTVESEED